MPFYTSDPVDPPATVREERQRAAQRVIDRLTFKPGDEVEVHKDLPPELGLYAGEGQPRGIVTGYLPGAAALVTVMCSLARGTEMELQFMEADLRAV